MFKKYLLRGVLLCSIPFCIYAEELSTIYVDESDSFESKYKDEIQIGKTQLNEETIETYPKGNGNINEVLEFLPDIQVDESSKETSYNAGEIQPKNISISGGKFYQNNFQIDGTSNNSLLDPVNNKHGQINDVKGHPQEIFIDSEMVKSITVYNSNVPAKFGRFTGGVVDVKTKHASFDFSGKVKYRYTSDKLTKFFVENENEFKTSNSSDMQPIFKKEFYGLSLNTPINESSALYSNITLKKSTIPLEHINTRKNEERKSNNFMFKYSNFLENDDIIDVTFNYSPYEEKRFLKNVKDSDYTIKGGGIKTSINHERQKDNYKVNSVFSISMTENSKEAPSNFYNWSTSDNFSWGTDLNTDVVNVGGYGDITKEQNIATLKSDFNLKDKLDLGYEIQYGNAIFNRKEDSNIYKVGTQTTATGTSPIKGLDGLTCFDSDACVTNDQYSSAKNFYEKFKADVGIITSALYTQKGFDLLDNVNLNLGLRYDYNNYMKNHDIAYRTSSTYDIFNNKSTILTFGFNKYYGNSFLTYKLREAKKPYVVYTRPLLGDTDAYNNQYFYPGEWEEHPRRGNTKTKYSDLKTPYSNEKSIGITQSLFGGILKVSKVYRNNKNGFSRTYGELQSDGYRYYSLTNDGYSSHESNKYSYNINFGKHFFTLTHATSKTKKTNETYDYESDGSEPDTKVYYEETYYDEEDGEFKTEDKSVSLGEISKQYDTKPKTFKLLYRYSYDKSLKLSTLITYKTKYQKVDKLQRTKSIYIINEETGEVSLTNASVYALVKYAPLTKVNLSLEYLHKIRKNDSLVFKTDIKNLFNKKQEASEPLEAFELGRQIWLEVAYKF